MDVWMRQPAILPKISGSSWRWAVESFARTVRPPTAQHPHGRLDAPAGDSPENLRQLLWDMSKMLLEILKISGLTSLALLGGKALSGFAGPHDAGPHHPDPYVRGSI